MKMDENLFNAMRGDCLTVIEAMGYSVNDVKTGGDAWGILHIVNRNRAYDDMHPGFSGGHWKRILPHTGIDYCDSAYTAGLVDAHIKTALSRIFPNAVFKDKYQY